MRRSARRVAGAAMDRYRTAVTERSRWLPAYLVAVDGADAALRLRRARRPGLHTPDPDPVTPTVARAALSESGELSFVLTGAWAWRRTVTGVGLRRGDERVRLDDALVVASGGVIRVNVALPRFEPALEAAELELLDDEGAPLDLPTPDLVQTRRAAAARLHKIAEAAAGGTGR